MVAAEAGGLSSLSCILWPRTLGLQSAHGWLSDPASSQQICAHVCTQISSKQNFERYLSSESLGGNHRCVHSKCSTLTPHLHFQDHMLPISHTAPLHFWKIIIDLSLNLLSYGHHYFKLLHTQNIHFISSIIAFQM